MRRRESIKLSRCMLYVPSWASHFALALLHKRKASSPPSFFFRRPPAEGRSRSPLLSGWASSRRMRNRLRRGDLVGKADGIGVWGNFSTSGWFFMTQIWRRLFLVLLGFGCAADRLLRIFRIGCTRMLCSSRGLLCSIGMYLRRFLCCHRFSIGLLPGIFRIWRCSPGSLSCSMRRQYRGRLAAC